MSSFCNHTHQLLRPCEAFRSCLKIYLYNWIPIRYYYFFGILFGLLSWNYFIGLLMLNFFPRHLSRSINVERVKTFFSEKTKMIFLIVHHVLSVLGDLREADELTITPPKKSNSMNVNKLVLGLFCAWAFLYKKVQFNEC